MFISVLYKYVGIRIYHDLGSLFHQFTVTLLEVVSLFYSKPVKRNGVFTTTGRPQPDHEDNALGGYGYDCSSTMGLFLA